MDPKSGFFRGYRKFYLHLVYDKSLYYYIPVQTPSLEKMVPEIWVEMLSASQIAEL